MSSADYRPVQKHIVMVTTYGRAFEVECASESDATFLARAVQVYTKYDDVVNHMDWAIARIKEIPAPEKEAK